MILPADKGKATVVMDKSEYDIKMNELLNGGQYKPIPKDPTANIINQIKSVLKLQNTNLSNGIIKKLSPQFSKPPHIYGVPKIHKNGTPLRPIVSSINSPSYELSKFLLPILKPLFGSEESYVINSYDFKEKIGKVNINLHDKLVSYDVCSLFTNIPVDELLGVVKTKLENDNSLPDRTTLTVSSIMQLLEVCVRHCYFQFDSKFYIQNFGLPMGGVLSPILSNIYMDYFENVALSGWNENPLLWLRYLDDIFCVWKSSYNGQNDFLNYINSLRPTIKFTVEQEAGNSLPFLDVLVKKTENGVQTTVYRKKTHTGQYLNYQSNSPNHVKLAIAKGLFYRAHKICSNNELLKQEINQITKELRGNDYPIKTIQTLYNKFKNKSSENILPKNDRDKKPTVVIPYIKGKSEKIYRINKKFNIQTSFKSNSSIRKLLTKVKPRNTDQETKNVVYKIPCECNRNYFGQTSRPFKRRLQEHKSSIRKQLENYSKLAEHVMKEEHRVKWEDSSIVYKEEKWKSRNLKEAACMLIDSNCISQPSATISPMFIPIIKKEVEDKIQKSKLFSSF